MTEIYLSYILMISVNEGWLRIRKIFKSLISMIEKRIVSFEEKLGLGFKS